MSTEPYMPPRDRDAQAAIRGYVSQVDNTLLRWIELDENTSLEPECGEDIDQVRDSLDDPVRLLEQVKHREANLTIRTPAALESLANAVEHIGANPGVHLVRSTRMPLARSIVLCTTLVLAGSCGGSSHQQADGAWQALPAEKSERTFDKWTRNDEDAAIARACGNVVTPRGEFRCGTFEKAGMTPASCGKVFRGWGDTVRNEQERLAFRTLSACLGMVDSCEKVNACFRLSALAAKGGGNSPRVCGQQGLNEVRLDAAKAAARYGRNTHNLASVASSREQPIEVCGLNGQLDWLTTARCADGSAPFASRQKAHAARVGTVGAGGPCGNLVDRYRVPCPEATYEVYMDFYMCGPGEKFR